MTWSEKAETGITGHICPCLFRTRSGKILLAADGWDGTTWSVDLWVSEGRGRLVAGTDRRLRLQRAVAQRGHLRATPGRHPGVLHPRGRGAAPRLQGDLARRRRHLAGSLPPPTCCPASGRPEAGLLRSGEVDRVLRLQQTPRACWCCTPRARPARQTRTAWRTPPGRISRPTSGVFSWSTTAAFIPTAPTPAGCSFRTATCTWCSTSSTTPPWRSSAATASAATTGSLAPEGGIPQIDSSKYQGGALPRAGRSAPAPNCIGRGPKPAPRLTRRRLPVRPARHGEALRFDSSRRRFHTGASEPWGPPLLSVRNLRTHFRTTLGTVHAVDDVSFDIHRGEVVGLVGESGCGKSITARSILGIVPPPGAVVGGSILYSGAAPEQPVDLARLSPKSAELRRFRGQEIAMIFQEPMSALQPRAHGGRPAHRGAQAVPRRPRRRRGAGARHRAAAASGHSEPREAYRRLRVRAQRGHAPARPDRNRHLRRAAVADRRRAHHRHRRHHPGQGAGAAQGTAGADRDGDPVQSPTTWG